MTNISILHGHFSFYFILLLVASSSKLIYFKSIFIMLITNVFNRKKNYLLVRRRFQGRLLFALKFYRIPRKMCNLIKNKKK